MKRKHKITALTITLRWISKKCTKNQKRNTKFWIREGFQTRPNLNNILCKNKDKLITSSHPGIYTLKCLCGSVYDAEPKKKIIRRSIKH